MALPDRLTAAYVMRQHYADKYARDRAVLEYTRRVLDARRGYRLDRRDEKYREEIAAQPLLEMSCDTFMIQKPAECGYCLRSFDAVFTADSKSHRVIGRSGNPVKPGFALCVRCWDRFVRTETDTKDSEIGECRFN